MKVCFKVNGKELFTQDLDTLIQVTDIVEILNNRYKNKKIEVTLLSKNEKEQLLEIKGLVINSVA